MQEVALWSPYPRLYRSSATFIVVADGIRSQREARFCSSTCICVVSRARALVVAQQRTVDKGLGLYFVLGARLTAVTVASPSSTAISYSTVAICSSKTRPRLHWKLALQDSPAMEVVL